VLAQNYTLEEWQAMDETTYVSQRYIYTLMLTLTFTLTFTLTLTLTLTHSPSHPPDIPDHPDIPPTLS